MPNIKSAAKRVRSSAVKRLRNRYKTVGTRRAIKELLQVKTKTEGTGLLPKVFSLIDKLAKTNIIHKNKASNQKSRLSRFVNGLS